MSPRGVAAVGWGMAAVVADVGLARLGYGVFLPSVCAAFRGSCVVAGALASTHLAGYLAGTFAAAPALRAFGTRRTAVGAHVALGMALALSAAMPSVLWLSAARVLTGIAAGVGLVAVVALALAAVSPSERGPANGWIFSGIGVGIVLCGIGTPFAAGAAAWRIASVVMGAFACAVAAGLASIPETPDAPASSERFEPRTLFRADGMLLFVLAYGGFGVAYISYATFAGAVLASRGSTPLEIAAAWIAFGLATALGAIGVGSLLGTRAARYAMAGVLLCAGAGATATAAGGTALTIAGAVLVGLGLAATPAVASAFARMRSTSATYPSAFAAITVFFGIGQFAGPLVSGWAAARYGLGEVPVFAALAYVCAGALALADARVARIGISA